MRATEHARRNLLLGNPLGVETQTAISFAKCRVLVAQAGF